jgi:phosphoribosylamine--glycine ligase
MPHRNVLVLGSGGREHALCWHLAQTGDRPQCAPGNDGIAEKFPCWSFSNTADLVQKIHEHKIEIVIVGPEKYLAEGIVDELEKAGISVFGPTQEAARLESDKSYAKDFAEAFGIPTARSQIVRDAHELKEAISKFSAPFVIKASGLAAGKGVWIGDSREEAIAFAQQALETHTSVVVEDFLVGEEISFFAMIDGDYFLILGGAQDHKRLLENNQGPNTGGMGAYSPVPILDAELQSKIVSRLLRPTLQGLKERNIRYRGFLFIGAMVVQGQPYLLEYNCRLGDPETQVLMLRLKTPLLELVKSLAAGKPMTPQMHAAVALNVVVAAKGYPDQPESGVDLSGIEKTPEDILVFHSGTEKVNGTWRSKGGRLFSVNTLKPDLFSAQQSIYPWIESLPFADQVLYRRDIAVHAYKHLRR